MSDLDCDIDCGDLCCCPDDDCLDCDCCSCDCSCCNCFGDDGDAWIFFGGSSSTNQNSGSSCFCCCFGGGGGVGSPPHRTVKAAPEPKTKLKKKRRLKRILMFWKTYKENDQEQKPAETQLDDMPPHRIYPPEWGLRGYYRDFVPPRTERMEKEKRKMEDML